jgi:hypothetical protein
MGQMSPLRRRMIEDMTVRNLAPATQQSYLYAVARFSRHFACDRLGLEHVRAYQVHLAAQKRSWSHINHQPGVLRATVLLWRDARPERGVGGHCQCSRTPEAAGRAER